MQNQFNEYPDCYLHIKECRSGETWIIPISGRKTLSLKTRVKEWIKSHFGEGWSLDGKFMPKIDGDYYAAIYTDNRPPESNIVWASGGFYVKCAEF